MFKNNNNKIQHSDYSQSSVKHWNQHHIWMLGCDQMRSCVFLFNGSEYHEPDEGAESSSPCWCMQCKWLPCESYFFFFVYAFSVPYILILFFYKYTQFIRIFCWWRWCSCEYVVFVESPLNTHSLLFSFSSLFPFQIKYIIVVCWLRYT